MKIYKKSLLYGALALPFVWQAVVTVILIWNRKVLLRRTVISSRQKTNGKRR